MNASKCAFNVGSGKILGSLVFKREIEANPDQISAIQRIQIPTAAKEVQTYTIVVVPEHLLKSLFRKAGFSGRISRWAVKLGQYYIQY